MNGLHCGPILGVDAMLVFFPHIMKHLVESIIRHRGEQFLEFDVILRLRLGSAVGV
jgi:hypothetical protein